MKTVKSITHRKIKKDVARGLAFTDTGEIHIDERLKGIEHLEILVHEILHIQNPKWGEAKIIGHSKEMSELLWQQGYRRVSL